MVRSDRAARLVVDDRARHRAREKTTVAPSGTSSVSSTKIAPRFCSVVTTCLLCTISLRT